MYICFSVLQSVREKLNEVDQRNQDQYRAVLR